MASIRKRNGKWQVQVRRQGIKAVTRSFHTLKDAREWENYMEAQADRRGLPSDPKALDKITTRQLLTRYKKEISVHKKGAENEAIIIDAFLNKSGLAETALAFITPEHFCDYRDKRLKSVKAATLCREFCIIQHAFEIARKEWCIPLPFNPLERVRKPKIKSQRERRISNTERSKILQESLSCRNKHIHDIILFALETAMRRGEILKVKWSDINFDTATLHISDSKNGHPRTIPLTPDAFALLERRKSSDSDASYVFPITSDSLKKAWQRLIKRAGISDLHFHDMRHEAISRFFEMGLSIPEVALISGHRDYRMLFRYTHLKAEDIAVKLEKK